MPASGIREIVHVALKMPDAIRLEVGEPDFATPQHIVDAAYEAASSGFTKYLPSAGLSSLRELLAERLSRVNGYEVNSEQIVVTVGGVQAVCASMLALLNPGDEVLIPDPAWPNYEMAILLQEGVPVHYPLYIQNEFVPTVADLERLVTPRTKLLVVNSPSNPTGAVFEKDVLVQLIEFARKHNIYLMADEVYDEMVFEGEHFSPALCDPERTISIYSFSKVYAMTGWRVGYLVANREIAQTVAKVQEPQISCVSSVGQKAAEAALTGSQVCVTEMCDSFRERRDAVVELLKQRDAYMYTPHGAFYIMVDIGVSGLGSRDFAFDLLEKQGVAVAPGTAFGNHGSDFVRISLATEKSDLLEGVSRLCEHMKHLQSN
jgi:aspartate/methionine/tyrosine aminotransferase